MRRVSPLGLIGVLIVLAVVLWLVAENWKAAAPALRGNSSDPTRGLGTENLPGLDQMEEATSEHADELRQALEQVDDY